MPLLNNENKIPCYIQNQLIHDKDIKSIVFVNSHLPADETLLVKSITLVKRITTVSVVNNFTKELNLNSVDISHIFIFLDNINDIPSASSAIANQEVFSLNNPKYYFLFIKPTDNSRDEIKNILDQVWKCHELWKYVLVFCMETEWLRIVSYNPFKQLLVEFQSDCNNTTMFSNMLKNVNGYRIKTIFFYTLKSSKMENGKCRGNDCEVMETFFNYINATNEEVVLNVTEDLLYPVSQDYIKQDRADVMFNNMFLYIELYKYSAFAFAHSNVYAVVPRASTLTFLTNIIFMFTPIVWIGIGIIPLIYYHLLSIFDNYAIGKHHVRGILISKYVYALIFTCIFQSMIITTLTSPKYRKNIETLHDLFESNLSIYGVKDWMYMFHREVAIRYKPWNNTSITSALNNLTLDGAYIVGEYWLNLFLKNKTRIGGTYNDYYYKIKEAVGTGLLTYYTRRNSPYREIIYKITLLRNMAGLDKEFGYREINFTKALKSKSLTLIHLQSSFVFLSVGWILSTLVFSIEVITNIILQHIKTK
ncbi:hypothetical protein GWI33_007816 [Rhynchophorus ferrugineus]|uniref:Ionotropic receptor n=1 Tax=Rhynchophorus ferrugineus TaxID=354439 RepID=A0A834ISB2_RHYFE|nr:hypothetical protein GWI33_007816 [Rhynchophorus ferrugineus]